MNNIQIPFIPKDEKKKKVDLNKASLVELKDIKARQEMMLRNKHFINSLPDKGAKCLNFYREVLEMLEKVELRDRMNTALANVNIPILSNGFSEKVYEHIKASVAPQDEDTSENRCKDTGSSKSIEPLNLDPKLESDERKSPSGPHVYKHFSKSLHDQSDDAPRWMKLNEPRVPYVPSSTASVNTEQGIPKYYEALNPPSTSQPATLLTLQESINLINEQTKTQDELQHEAAEKCLKTWNHIIHGEATGSTGVKNLGVTFRVPVQDKSSDEEDDLSSDEDCITEESEPENEEDNSKADEFLSRLVNANIVLN